MRAICKLAIDGMNETDTSYPIILKKITFNLFPHYLTTRRNEGEGFLSKESYFGVISAFIHMYRMSGDTIPEEFKIELSQFMSGMKRTVSSQKAESGESLDEEKKLMSYEVYKNICEFLFEGEGDDYAFAHVFLTLEYYLLAQSDNCLAMIVNHVQWDNDSLVFNFSKMKGHHSGDKSGDPWHVYSNPKNLELFPVLALTKYLLSHLDLMNGNFTLFP